MSGYGKADYSIKNNVIEAGINKIGRASCRERV